ncbi:MAG TPA: mercury methylation corrinoid protein HgcA [Deltaproteobacteria bacterium]|nr:mercury methylation corrinoid protein HgcA [Deltaproteobacteria bacterium]
MDQQGSSERKGAGRVVLPMAPASCGTEDVPAKAPGMDQPFVEGVHAGPRGDIPRVGSRLRSADRWGTIKARLGVGRMRYAIDPGLYALGSPDETSPVLVSANYKMSFDCLRSALPGRDAWILVLDTKGINVWCAAGKGTFGTAELVRRIETSGLKDIVSHRTVILPQLSAPGVAAHTVKERSGFSVQYGPIRARDLGAYLDAGLKATPQMRCMTFALRDRAVLIPIELFEALKAALIVVPVMFIASGFLGQGGFADNLAGDGLFTLLALGLSILAGAVLMPLLLPYLPGRAFAAKGFAIGAATALLLIAGWGSDLSTWRGALHAAAWIMIPAAIAGYLAMNFTGASTYTSLSGVRREMRWAVPLEIGTAAAGIIMWIASGVIA